MSLIWSDTWKRPDGIIFSKETGDKHWTTDCLHVKTSVSIRHLWGHTCSCICLPIGFILSRLEKKIRACGHDFEDVVSAYLNWKNPRKDVTDLIGQMEVLTVLKYSPRWHNILERNRRHADDNEL